MLDSHCHLDRYANPTKVALEAAHRNVFILAVTNLPSHFRDSLSHVKELRRVRLALGLHPLAEGAHSHELDLFTQLLPQTSFIGEVGLDFSSKGRSTRTRQISNFQFVAERTAALNKVLSVHSRGAEKEVLEILSGAGVRSVILHWFSGSRAILNRAISDGYYFSVNPTMTLSERGRRIISLIPRDRLLSESDGPFAQIGGVSALPWDVSRLETFLSTTWGLSGAEVSSQIWANFQRLLIPLRSKSGSIQGK